MTIIIHQKRPDSINKKVIDRKKEKAIIKKKIGTRKKMKILVQDVTNMPLVSSNKLMLCCGYDVNLLPGETKEIHTGVQIDLTDEYQGVLINKLKRKDVIVDLENAYLSNKPGCVKAILKNVSDFAAFLPKGEHLMEVIIFKPFELPVDINTGAILA